MEVRESSWFDDEVRDFLIDNNISLVWSVRDELTTPQLLTTDQIYVRLIGDKSINEKDFGHIVKDRSKELKEFAKHLKEIQEDNTTTTALFPNSLSFNHMYSCYTIFF